jgi:hypothetical protein
VKRLYVPLENQNQKALISSYDWIRFANTPIYKMDVPTSHGETTRSKNHQLGVHGVGKSILPHKNKTTTYRQKTLVLRRSSAFLTNTNMKTRWSSRCIKSSTLDWRLCFFTPQIWVHSSKSMHGVKMEAQSFPKMSYQTLMTSCPENDSGLMSVEDQWHPSNFCLWIPCYSFRNHTFGFQWDLPVSQKHFSGSISSENCAPSENDNLPMSCFGALAFPWNSRLQHTWRWRRIKLAVLVVELLVFYSTTLRFMSKKKTYRSFWMAKFLFKNSILARHGVESKCCEYHATRSALLSQHISALLYCGLASNFSQKSESFVIRSSQHIWGPYFSLGFLVSSHSHLICLISKIRISPLYGVCCCCF